MSWELKDAHVPAQSVSIRVHHWGRDCAPGTACPAAGVFPAGVCLQLSHGLTLRYRHRASVAGKAQQHPSLRRCDQGQRCIFVPGMPMEPRQTQATGYPFRTARTLASLYSFPSWQRSQHPSPSHGPSRHSPMVSVWDGTFPHPFVLPSTRHLSTTRPRAPQGALEQRSFPHRTALPVTPLSLEQSLPLTPGLSIMRLRPGHRGEGDIAGWSSAPTVTAHMLNLVSFLMELA